MEDFSDLIAQVGRLTGRVEEAMKHLATKEDLTAISVKLDSHLETHKAESVLSRRIKIMAISALIAGVPALITALITVFF